MELKDEGEGSEPEQQSKAIGKAAGKKSGQSQGGNDDLQKSH